MYLLTVEDKDTIQIFKHYQRDSMKSTSKRHAQTLFAELSARTEEIYQNQLLKHLSDEQQNVVIQHRSRKDDNYNNMFLSIINQNQCDLNLIINSLQQYAEEVINLSKPKLITKEEVEQVFINILYDSFKTNDDKERYLRESFEAQNQTLMRILANHHEVNDMNALRSEIKQFLLTNFGPDTFKSLREAINELYAKGFLSGDDNQVLRDLNLREDKHLLAAWDTYTVMLDEEELAETL